MPIAPVTTRLDVFKVPGRRPYRWAVLGAYVGVAGLSQLLWVNFAPVLGLIKTRYGVSEMLASALVLVFPLLYVFFSIPAGALIDSRGYRLTVGLGAAVMALGACIRIYEVTFWALMAGQLLIAVGQPFIVNGISKLVADWFSEEQSAIATGLGTMGMFIGMALGMAVTPKLVAAYELRGAMIVWAAVALVAAIVFVLVVKPNSEAVKSSAAGQVGWRGFRKILADRRLVLMFTLAFLGLGYFNGLTTWLEQIVAPNGIGSQDAGLIGGTLILGGILGAAIIPALSDKLRRRKPFLLACAGAALCTVYLLCTGKQLGLLLALGAVHGFFFMPAFALLLEMTSQLAGKQNAGAATSLLMLAGNAGGVVMILTVPLLKGSSPTYHSSVLFLTGLMALTLLLGTLAPETFAIKPGAGSPAPGAAN